MLEQYVEELYLPASTGTAAAVAIAAESSAA
jgi:hypothetical protein